MHDGQGGDVPVAEITILDSRPELTGRGFTPGLFLARQTSAETPVGRKIFIPDM